MVLGIVGVAGGMLCYLVHTDNRPRIFYLVHTDVFA
jgi:hypothetical protein